MEEKLEKCPVCDSHQLSTYGHIKDHKVSRETFKLDQCEACGLVFTNPRPDEVNIGKYYQSENYVSHTDTKKGLINFLYHQVRKITLRKKLRWINKFTVNKRSLLDVGCGTGYFLKTCKSNGWSISGVEPDEGAREIARKNTEANISSSLDSVEKKEYDAITLWHVLEHIHDLNGSIKKLSQLLSQTGTVFVALPNYKCYDRKIYQEYWDGYEVPRHLYHFSIDTVDKLLNKHGFKIIDIKPMIFDAFYACMLSEGYKNQGKMNMPRAFFNGLISNMKARKNKNYSALLYIVKRK